MFGLIAEMSWGIILVSVLFGAIEQNTKNRLKAPLVDESAINQELLATEVQ